LASKTCSETSIAQGDLCLATTFRMCRVVNAQNGCGIERSAKALLACATDVYFCSISVENLTEPSGKISTRGAVPRIPMVPIGVLTFMFPVCATSPAMNVNVPLVKLIRLALE
jgi:hypothetical protein